MMSEVPKFKVAIAHAAPVMLDLTATTNKACALIEETARNGAALVVFPETYIPAFPVWSALRAPIYNHDLFCRLAANAMTVPGPEVERICATARSAGVIVSLGINERSSASIGCIFNANILIGPDGSILNHHRKLMPTFYEKLSWAPGDGAGLRVCDTACGRIGMLICGENTNPLARYTMMAQAEQVHIASYPPVWPTHGPEAGGDYDLAQAIRLRAGAHSFEAKAFTVVASGFMDQAMYKMLSALDADAARILDNSPRGVSLVTGPSGSIISPELRDEEGLLYAEIDVSQCVAPKQFHDISGGYNRFDIFQLTVNRSAHRPVTFVLRETGLDSDQSVVAASELELQSQNDEMIP
jgi:aliphatic nitrilase